MREAGAERGSKRQQAGSSYSYKHFDKSMSMDAKQGMMNGSKKKKRPKGRSSSERQQNGAFGGGGPCSRLAGLRPRKKIKRDPLAHPDGAPLMLLSLLVLIKNYFVCLALLACARRQINFSVSE